METVFILIAKKLVVLICYLKRKKTALYFVPTHVRTGVSCVLYVRMHVHTYYVSRNKRSTNVRTKKKYFLIFIGFNSIYLFVYIRTYVRTCMTKQDGRTPKNQKWSKRTQQTGGKSPH